MLPGQMSPLQLSGQNLVRISIDIAVADIEFVWWRVVEGGSCWCADPFACPTQLGVR